MERKNHFDMEAYIRKRMMEISSLEDRQLYKEIVGNLLLELYRYNQTSYNTLEQRILSESSSGQSGFAIYLTMTDLEHYDATDTFMYPIIEEDVFPKELSKKEIKEAIAKGEEVKLYTIFMEVEASKIYKLLHHERAFTGVIRTENREYKGIFKVRRNEAYLDMVKNLYYIFAANNQSWVTVCEAYLTKMLDVYLCSAEAIPESEEILDIHVDFGEESAAVKYGMIPLWNLKQLTEKTSTYPDPSIDKINYEHPIFAQRLKTDCEYLVMNTDIEITNIRRTNGDLMISCPEDKPCDWKLYQVNKLDNAGYYLYPLLSNQYKESFSGNITEMYRKSIKTRAEMARLIESFSYGEYVRFQGMEIQEQLPPNWEASNYNMDGFIQDEIRIGNSQQVLLLSFTHVEQDCYLNEDIMSFLVTQVQKIFPEYLCVGRLIKEA